MDYAEKKARLAKEMKESADEVRLQKNTTNLFRQRNSTSAKKLNVHDLQDVLEIHPTERWVEVEGMCTFEKLVDALLPHRLMPAVVPELKSITIGGAISGVGVESTSFRYGLVHENVLDMDVLLADGTVVTCTPTNEYSDLFFALPNSYGTLGYIVRVRLRTIAIQDFVHITHARFSNTQKFVEALAAMMSRPSIDFLEGIFFSAREQYITSGTMCDTAQNPSDYTYMHIYYHSIRLRNEDFLSTHDFIWRWDTDWFWDSKFFFAEYSLIRWLMGRKRLNSKFYMRLLQLTRRFRMPARARAWRRWHSEPVIQDIAIPLRAVSEFLEFVEKEVGITPIWVCPIGRTVEKSTFPLFPLDKSDVYVNTGFWGTVRTREPYARGHFNRLVEMKTSALAGIKSLYSDSYYTQDEFWKIYGKSAYDALKKKYDPRGRFKGLYEKCVLKG